MRSHAEQLDDSRAAVIVVAEEMSPEPGHLKGAVASHGTAKAVKREAKTHLAEHEALWMRY